MKNIILYLLSPLFVLAFGTAASLANPADAPAELKKLVAQSKTLVAFETADLDGDGRKDYVFIVQHRKTARDGDEDEGERVLKIAIRLPDGALKIVKTNGKVVFCEQCGGVFGDPFAGLAAAARTFTVSHYGGSGWRWSNSYKFNYSKQDNTWQLVQVDESSFHAADPEKAKSKKYRPPKDFGKIDISEFDPEKFRGVGPR